MTFNFSSPLLNAIIDSLSDLEEPLARYLDAVNEWKARDNDKPSLWKDKTKYPEIEDARDVSGPPLRISWAPLPRSPFRS